MYVEHTRSFRMMPTRCFFIDVVQNRTIADVWVGRIGSADTGRSCENRSSQRVACFGTIRKTMTQFEAWLTNSTGYLKATLPKASHQDRDHRLRIGKA